MWLTPKLISECTPNSNFSANHGDNENDQDKENHLDDKSEGNYPANKYICKVKNRKKVFVSLYFTPCSNVFNVDFKHLIVQ